MSLGAAIIAFTGREEVTRTASMATSLVGIVHRHVERLPLLAHPPHEDGHEAEALGDLPGDEVEERAGELDVIERHPGDAQLLPERLRELRLVHDAEVDQDLAELPPLRLLNGESLVQALGRDELGLDEQLSDPQSFH